MRPSDSFADPDNMAAGTGLIGLVDPFVSTPRKGAPTGLAPISRAASFDIASYARILQHVTKLYPFDPAAVSASLSSLGGHSSSLPLPNGVGPVDGIKGSPRDSLPGDKELTTRKGSPTAGGEKTPLDLSTQGLKALYSQYRRITLNQIRPKVVEDAWVENDVVLDWTDSKVVAYNPAQKLFMCAVCECVGFLSRVAEHWLGAHANLRVFHCPRCPYTSAWSRCVKMHLTRQHQEQQFADTTMWKENARLLEVTKLMQDLRTKVENRIDSSSALADKRFYCPHCPYATDRRDLYTRHENIHKDNKPFHCYVCLKQFNRADHVKKHFVRMHPESHYDISRIRKQQQQPPSTVSNSSSSSRASAAPQTPTTKQQQQQQSPSNAAAASSSSRASGTQTQTTAKAPPNAPKPSPIQPPPTTSEHGVSIIPTTVNAILSQAATFRPIEDPYPVPIPCTDPAFHAPEKVVVPEMPNPPDPQVMPLEMDSHIQITPKTEPMPKSRRRSERAFSCHYCHWSGTDNWCLKRHMNTHIKPFACVLCEYKAARAERLSTHVWKVHSKRICNKCNYLADTQERLLEHTREEHHNNPYSRRHICGSCGMSFDTRANLETHIHLSHTRPKSPFDVVQITPIPVPDTGKDSLEAAAKCPLPGEETLSLICPIESCSEPCESSGVLADHVRLIHGGLFASRCPHCSYNLTQDELAKDHWLTHHEDVCNACVHVFTSVYGPQLWKKVHNRPQSSGSPLNDIVSGLNKKKIDPEGFTKHEPLLHPESTSGSTEPTDNELDRHTSSKRKRKQSCPKKVINISTDHNGLQHQTTSTLKPPFSTTTKTTKLRRPTCLKCSHRPHFPTLNRLLVHNKIKHSVAASKRRNFSSIRRRRRLRILLS